MRIRVLPVRLISLSLFVIMLLGCKRDPYSVNVGKIECDIEIKDLGKDIFETSPPSLGMMADSLRVSYGTALATYSTVVGLGSPYDEKWKSSFILFATDLHNLALYDSVRQVWPVLKPLEESLERAFKHYLFYFPEADVPKVITCITAFNNSIVIDDSLLMIGLDRYLGAGSKYYPALGIFKYQSRKMTPSYTVTDCMHAWASTEWDYRDAGYVTGNLLTSIIHESKLVYLTRCMVPSAPDTIVFGFTKKQLDFCRENEAQVWQYLISQDLLFTTDGFLIRKFVGEAPFTSYFTEEAPGRTVVWTGFRIIERYMRNNPRISLKELMETTDCQAILTGARYNPD